MSQDTRGEGCGIYPFLFTHTAFKDACVWHDGAYTQNSIHQKKYSRADIDRVFLNQMLHIAAEKKSWWLRQQAWLFYNITRLTGAVWWEGKY